jgi:hypothetical protein
VLLLHSVLHSHTLLHSVAAERQLAAHPDPPLTKASFVPTGASGLIPVMIARQSSHHSTCGSSQCKQQKAFSEGMPGKQAH